MGAYAGICGPIFGFDLVDKWTVRFTGLKIGVHSLHTAADANQTFLVNGLMSVAVHLTGALSVDGTGARHLEVLTASVEAVVAYGQDED